MSAPVGDGAAARGDAAGGARVVVVTGTSSGLGHAVAAALLADGDIVVGVSRRPVEATSFGEGSPRYHHVCHDLGELGSLKALSDRIVREHGAPFGLVNNAAVGIDGLLATMHTSEIERMVRLNVTSPMVLTKYLVRPMVSARRGRVVNVSSIVAHTGYKGLAAYGATKAAMEGFTRSLAREVGSRRVTVNAIAPGFLDTEMTVSLAGAEADRIRRRAALGVLAPLSDVAAGVRYLLSDAAASVTGTTLTIDAGATA